MNMAAATHSHIPRRWLGVPKRRTNLRGMGQTADEDAALAQSQLLQQGFTQQQIDALAAAGADASTMMGIATADNSTTAYNGVMSALTGIPANQLSSAGIGASSANWFNESTVIGGIPNYMLVGGLAFLAMIAFTAEKRYR
jgi:hypothetical protein